MYSMRRLLLILAAMLLSLGGLVVASLPAHAATGLTAAFSSENRGSYFWDKYVVTNSTGASITGWTIEFDLPSGVTVSQYYYGAVTTSGSHVSATNEFYNATVAPGGTTEPYSFSFSASGPGTPANCRINGNRCDGGADRSPGAPTNLKVTTKTTKTMSLSWTAAVATDFPIASYDVYRGTTLAKTVTGTSATVTGLTGNTSYTFTVKARDSHGNVSAASNAASGTTLNPADDTTPPTAPSALHSTGKTSTSVSLAWTASTDAHGIAGYDIYRGTTKAKSVTGTGTTTTVTGLSPLTTYTFTVKARDTYDNVSAASNAVSVTTNDVVGGGSYARVGYFVQWGIYGRQYFVKNLETTGAAAKLTHINYAFTNLDPVNLTCLNGVVHGVSSNPEDPDQGTGGGDAEADYGRPFSPSESVDGVGDSGFAPLQGNFNQLKKLKAKHSNLKVLMSIGGWTYSKFFSDAAATDASRKKFVSSCIDMYIKGNLPAYNGHGGAGSAAGIFDGIDLDWEWPGSPGHPGNHVGANDKANLTLLLKEFRTELDALGATTGKHYLLTAFTPADQVKITNGWDLSQVFKYLDFANVQGYDFHGSGSDNSWEPNRTGHQANLNADPADPYSFHFSDASAIQLYFDAGVNPRKLTIGVPFYGRGWQGVTDGGKHGAWQSANGAAPGQFAEEAGTRGYSNLVASVPGCTVFHDTTVVATWCYTGSQWWTFDDAWSLGQKTAWIKSKGLLGVMIWEMSGDTGTLMGAIDTGLH
jgi:chitinase